MHPEAISMLLTCALVALFAVLLVLTFVLIASVSVAASAGAIAAVQSGPTPLARIACAVLGALSLLVALVGVAVQWMVGWGLALTLFCLALTVVGITATAVSIRPQWLSETRARWKTGVAP